MRSYSLSFITLLLLLPAFSAGCFLNRPQGTIEGRWVRVDDSAAGTILVVKPEGDFYTGRFEIISGAIAPRFALSDVKWKDLRRVHDGLYRGQDLFKTFEYGTLNPTYYDVEFRVTGNELRTSFMASIGNIDAEQQRWLRLAE